MSQTIAPAVLPNANDACWCGSGRKYKRCHKQVEGRVVQGEISPYRPVPAHIARPAEHLGGQRAGAAHALDEPRGLDQRLVPPGRDAGLGIGRAADLRRHGAYRR